MRGKFYDLRVLENVGPISGDDGLLARKTNVLFT
jgi:hypothetical protein